MGDNLGPWQLVGRHRRLAAFANQGLATVVQQDGAAEVVYRGDWSIPCRLRRQGWVHIGDPDSFGGHLIDPYQGRPGAPSKLYEVTTPAGDHFDYAHPLAPDELMNNSFVAISPDGEWMVSGEWGQMSRLLVFPTPVLNPATAPTGGSLPLVATIALDRPVRNMQGATFVDPTTLLCTTDDPMSDLWPTPQQLLQVRLAGPLTGVDTTAEVTSLGQPAMESLCPGTFEVEGIDFSAVTGDLLIDVVPPKPCRLWTTIYQYRESP